MPTLGTQIWHHPTQHWQGTVVPSQMIPSAGGKAHSGLSFGDPIMAQGVLSWKRSQKIFRKSFGSLSFIYLDAHDLVAHAGISGPVSQFSSKPEGMAAQSAKDRRKNFLKMGKMLEMARRLHPAGMWQGGRRAQQEPWHSPRAGLSQSPGIHSCQPPAPLLTTN